MKKAAFRNFIAVAVAVGLAFALAACGKSKTSGVDSGKPKYVNIAITNDPGTVNPLATNNVMGTHITGILYLPLAAQNEELKFSYRLAENINTTDNRIFTIKINPKVKWTDGTPVTADDVVFTFNAYTNPKTSYRDPSAYGVIVGTNTAGLLPEGETTLSGVKKIDNYTLTVEVKYPITLDIFNLTIGSIRTLPKHIAEPAGLENLLKSDLLQNPKVTNGPFKFKEYVPGQYLAFTANPDYFLGAPKLDELNFKILPGTQITAQLESGEVDINFPLVGNIPNDDYDRIRSLTNIHTKQGLPSNIQVVFLNSKVIDNLKVRQAISLAIDRESILKNVLKGEAYISRTPVTNQIQYWNEGAARPVYDLERAKQLISESGWDLSKRLVFSLPTGNTTRERVGAIIAEALRGIGLNVVIERADLATTLGHVQKCEYDISIIGMPDVPLNIVSYLRVYASTRYTWTNYSNPRADALVETIMTSVDDNVLKSSYYELQQLIADEVSVTGVYSELALRGINNRIVYGDLAEYGALLDLEKWDVK